ncbi:squalene/phytoene synthase family protein [Polynucleobacter sp. UK-Mo-2m-Kol15]|uniref:squalene/phytoene synthase family protein n=1 Tax=Polynucleobacter sp. UK-Mo-2m-Kol15 TaxID=2576916 RepID=UPI001C0D36E7|nr:squalene/phytoene synthase family protein [Polynucleobacter sp. UK-Mo-2m-Kol15]MBU3574637.1 squalene/phytoene synthase family protein [Polynucleobacter sp. UK-Mo-2m-Kol15]
MHPKENPNSDLAYQKAILGSVSRTFALTIPLLPPAIEVVVSNTYLLCRIVDTIEDAAELSPPNKQYLSKVFLDAVLGVIPVDAFVIPCLDALKDYSNADELDLIEHTPTVLRILRTFPDRDRAAISRCVSIMSDGMSHFHGRQTQDGLKDLAEFEEYCYVVAGVVGELLTTIFSNYSPEFARRIEGHQQLAIAFGQALQMTNILKDSPEDRSRGVSWKPASMSQAELLKLAYEKLQDSMNYILLIPENEIGIRRFCFLAFGLAVMTLEKIATRKEFSKQSGLKLSRNTVWIFYAFTKIATSSKLLMTSFFYAASSQLRKLSTKNS